MKRKCSLEEKLEAIALVEQGMSARSVSEKLHLGHHVLFEWLAAYKYRGIQGLIPKGKRKRKFSYEEKCKIVCEYQKSELTLFQLSAMYNGGTVLLLYAVLTLTFPRDEGYTFDSFIGMDCPPPNWNEGLDPVLT